jgi:hypothetical protein
MNRRNVLPFGVAAAVMASAGIALLTASPAAAASCNAPAGSSCVAVSTGTSVKSIRVNGRCLIGSGKHSTVYIHQFDRPRIETYGGTRCEGGTRNNAWVNVSQYDSENYRWIVSH